MSFHGKTRTEVESGMKYYLQHHPDRVKSELKKSKYQKYFQYRLGLILINAILAAKLMHLQEQIENIDSDDCDDENTVEDDGIDAERIVE